MEPGGENHLPSAHEFVLSCLADYDELDLLQISDLCEDEEYAYGTIRRMARDLESKGLIYRTNPDEIGIRIRARYALQK